MLSDEQLKEIEKDYRPEWQAAAVFWKLLELNWEKKFGKPMWPAGATK